MLDITSGLRPPLDEPAGYCEYHAQFAWGTCLHSLLRNDGTKRVSGVGIVGNFTDVAPSTHVKASRYMPPDSIEPQEHRTLVGGSDLVWRHTILGTASRFSTWRMTAIRTSTGWARKLRADRVEVETSIREQGRMMRGDGQGNFEDITIRARLLDIHGRRI